MTIKWSDGFDHYAPAGTPGDKVQQYLTAAGYDIRNAAALTFSVIEGRRPGAGALRFTIPKNSQVNASLSWGFTSAADTVIFGFAMRATGTRKRICRIENVADIEWSPTTGKLEIDGVAGASVLILNEWYYFEIECDRVLKEVRVWANNELQITSPWLASPPAKFNITWGQTAAQVEDGIQDLDDFYAMDSSAGQYTTRLQPIEITTKLPTADVETNWSVVGTVDPAHWKVAAQLLPGDAGKPYLQSNVNGARDVFRSNAVLPTQNQVFAVSVLAYARKGDLDARQIGLLLKSGVAESEITLPLTEQFKYYQTTYENPPGGGSWNANNVESSEFGIVTR